MRKPHPYIPQPDCSMGFPGLGVGQRCLPEREPLTYSVQVLSSPGLVCFSRGSPTLSSRDCRDGRQSGTLEEHHHFRGLRPWGPRWKGAHPLATNSRRAKSGYSKGTLSWGGEGALG